MRAIQIEEFGGPEVLTVREVDEPVAGAGEQVFDVLAAGINYADTHQSEDSYLAKQKLPLIPGSEVVVEAATAWHLLRTSTHLAPGESVVVHAGAGGVGTMAIQLAQRWGAGRVIATASSPEKRALALELGADVAIDSNVEDMREALREANDGRGVDIVLEMTGGRVCDQSLAALAPFGRLAFFGQASRQAPSKVDPTVLMAHSTAVIGFWLAHVARRPDMMGAAVNELLALIDGDVIRPIIGGSYALADAADAHRALLERSSIGKLILLPQS
jgi:NADPH2:quinone reductase